MRGVASGYSSHFTVRQSQAEPYRTLPRHSRTWRLRDINLKSARRGVRRFSTWQETSKLDFQRGEDGTLPRSSLIANNELKTLEYPNNGRSVDY